MSIPTFYSIALAQDGTECASRECDEPAVQVFTVGPRAHAGCVAHMRDMISFVRADADAQYTEHMRKADEYRETIAKMNQFLRALRRLSPDE